MHILEDWRIRAVEQKADRANSRPYELDSLRSDVGGLERANRELCAEIDRLRSRLEASEERFAALEQAIGELTHNN